MKNKCWCGMDLDSKEVHKQHEVKQEEICSICKYGDGKWEERQGEKLRDNLPVCEKCKADGWTNDPKEVFDGIRNDPVLSKIIDVESPYNI